MNGVLIDTSIIIDHIRIYQKDKKTLFINLLEKYEEIYFCAISIAEIFSGKSAAKNEEKIRQLFNLGEIINLTPKLMEKAGKIRRETEISLIDAIIAASALELNLSLATLNKKDFKKIKGLALI
jgi:Predicted nucleic acid-binding protein, contains PIN domain